MSNAARPARAYATPPATPSAPLSLIAPDQAADGYVPGACNIGPWEIRRRRAFAIVGFAVAAAILAGMIAAGTPAAARLVLLVPLWGGAFSWLQARRRFCAAFALAGIANFGDTAGSRQDVRDAASHRADLWAIARMTRDSFLIALAATLVAVLLPV
jgi:hypothetical protein